MSDEIRRVPAPRTPIGKFLHHQGRALEESGKAVLALLPNGFRNHANQAIHESGQAWGALANGVIDAVQDGLDKLRITERANDPDEKVRVEVE